MSIPFPENLSDVDWIEKVRQLEWLMEAGHLPIKMNNDGTDD